MNKNVLVVIDAQNDFIDGALRNEDAIKKVPEIAKYINDFDGTVIFTQDTHYEDYLNTLEGQKLPIKHCIKDTKGWNINTIILAPALTALYNFNPDTEKMLEKIFNAGEFPFQLNKKKKNIEFIWKNTFGDVKNLPNNKNIKDADTIYICGFDTNICVVSNALILRAFYPNKKIVVLKDLCSGTSKEDHEDALTVMKSCQIDIE